MLYTKLCIEIKTKKIVNSYRGSKEITNKHPDLYRWDDIRINEGTEDEPNYVGIEIPTDWLDGEWYYIDGQIVDKNGNVWGEEVTEE